MNTQMALERQGQAPWHLDSQLAPEHFLGRPWRRACFRALGLGLALWLSFCRQATATAPNDFCSGADVIPPAGPFPWWSAPRDITGLSTNGDLVVPSCQPQVANSLWYVFTPAQTGTFTISTCDDAPTATTVEDTVMAIYTSANGCAGPFTEVEQLCNEPGCADDSCGLAGYQAAITARLQAATTYYIVVWRYKDGPPTAGATLVQLRVTELDRPPANDTCPTATPLTLNRPVAGTTVGAQNDYQVGSDACFTNQFDRLSPAEGPDVAYSFQAPADGCYSFKVYQFASVAPHDLVLYLLPSCPKGPTPIQVSACLGAANRSRVSSAEEIVCVPLQAGQTVYLVVDEHGCTPGSSFTVLVTPCKGETEPNDTPATAPPFACGVIGFMQTLRDVDFFALGAPAAGARLFALLDGVSASRTDFDLRATTSTNTLEYDDDNNDPAFGDKSPNLAGTPLTGEPTFLRVNYKDHTMAGPYRLYATVQPPAELAQAEIEPNDTPAQAQASGNTSGQGYFRGALQTNASLADVDVYAFTAKAGELILVSLDCDPWRDNTPFDARLELLDANGTPLIMVDDSFLVTSSTETILGVLDAPRPYSPGEGLVYRPSADGLFYVRISSGESNITTSKVGDYLLSISKNCPICCLRRPTLLLRPAPVAGQWTLVLEGPPGVSYALQATSDFTDWPEVSRGTTGPDGLCSFNLTEDPQTSRFFRAVQVP